MTCCGWYLPPPNTSYWLVLTVGKYVTPSLLDIDQQGIQPDFQIFPGFTKANQALSACKVPTSR